MGGIALHVYEGGRKRAGRDCLTCLQRGKKGEGLSNKFVKMDKDSGRIF